MKENFIIIFLVFMITSLICGYAAAQAPAAETIVLKAKDPGFFTERDVPVIRNNDKPDGTVRLRFYKDMPNVAYISAADYLAMWIPGAQMNVEQIKTGVYKLTSPTGTALVDTIKNTISSEDFASFVSLEELNEEIPFPVLKFIGIETEPVSAETFFDFSKYGIELFGEDEAVYFPFALISDMYSNYFGILHSGFNGEKVVMNYSLYDWMLSNIDKSYSEGLLKQISRSGQKTWPISHIKNCAL